MALEQWEIDLRKQLDKKVITPKHVKTLEDKVVETIQGAPTVVPKPKPAGNNTSLMMVLLIVLGLAMLFAYDEKSGGGFQSWIASKFHPAVTDTVVLPKTQNTDITALQDDIQRIESDNQKLAAKVKFNTDRLNLMGMLLNENFTIIKNNYDKNNLMFFKRDWTFDQMPRHITLTDEDREYLKKFVKVQ
jgi:hypothetical protein